VQLLASRFGRAAESTQDTDGAALQRIARRERAALLSYWITPTRSFVWVVTPDRIELVELPANSEIAPLVQAYRTFLESGLRDPIATAFEPAERLHRTLVAPVTPHLQGLERVIIAPDGPLHALPFDALIVGGERPHYWIEDVTITTAPSLSLLAAPRNRVTAGDSLLAFGAPQPDTPGLPPLPHASDELTTLAAQRRNVTVISGRDATPEAFAAAKPSQFARIHFASHAIANPVSPLDSGIVTAPSERGGTRLLARALLETPLTADLVTISACRSAGARVIAGEGLVGFAWAMLHAGARHVIAGLWDVNDRSTLDLMTALYASLDSGATPAEALRTAKLQLLRGNAAFRHPFYWAPFTVFAGPGPVRAATSVPPAAAR
jgi:CHAT domain-containing protein